MVATPPNILRPAEKGNDTVPTFLTQTRTVNFKISKLWFDAQKEKVSFDFSCVWTQQYSICGGLYIFPQAPGVTYSTLPTQGLSPYIGQQTWRDILASTKDRDNHCFKLWAKTLDLCLSTDMPIGCQTVCSYRERELKQQQKQQSKIFLFFASRHTSRILCRQGQRFDEGQGVNPGSVLEYPTTEKHVE